MEAGRLHSMIPLSGITHAPTTGGRREPADAPGAVPPRRAGAGRSGLRPLLRWARIANGGPLSVPIIVQKYGGTSVGTSSGSRPSPTGSFAPRRTASTSCVVVSAMGDTTDELLAMAKQIAPVPEPARAGHAAHGGRAHRHVAARDRHQRARLQGGVATPARRPASSPTRSTARPASSRSGPSGSWSRSGAGNVVIIAGFQGLSTQLRHHHARPWRLRHDRRGDGGRPREPRSARSTRTCRACSPPTPGSSRPRGRSR